jgi:hypothetical protein
MPPGSRPKYRFCMNLGKGAKFCRPGVLIGKITMPTFVVSELTARSAARPVGDVGDTPGHFYAHMKYQGPRPDGRGPFVFHPHCFGASGFFNSA